MELKDKTLRSCWGASARVVRVSGGYVERDDVYQEIVLGLLGYDDEKIEEWIERGQLATVLYRIGLSYVEKERRARTGAERGDFTYYTPALLADLLPDAWGVDSLLPGGTTHDPVGLRGKSRPSETGNRLAMLVDVRDCLQRLTPENVEILHAAYAPNGIGAEAMAKQLGKTDEAMRKATRRVMWKMTEKLGGEPPFYPRARKSISNAHAQAITNEQEG